MHLNLYCFIVIIVYIDYNISIQGLYELTFSFPIAENWVNLDHFGSVFTSTNWDNVIANPDNLFTHGDCNLRIRTQKKLLQAKKRKSTDIEANDDPPVLENSPKRAEKQNSLSVT